MLCGTAAGALPQAEALVIDCIRARADRDQNLVRFVPAGDHPGRAGDQVNGLTEQLIDELAGVGLGREAPRQTQQRFAATVQDSDTLGGNQACLDVDETERLGQIVVGAGLHARDAVVGVTERREQDEIRIRHAGPGPNATAELDAVQARHHPITDHDVRARRVVQLERFGAVGRAGRRVAEIFDYIGDQGTKIRIVLGNKDSNMGLRGPGVDAARMPT